MIWKWLDLLNDDRDAIFMKDTRVGLNESMFKKYQGAASLYPKDEYNKSVMRFDYFGVLPVSLGQIDYNYRTPESIDTTFEFSFSKLTPILL